MLLLLMLPISMTFYTSNMFCTKVNGNASGYLEQAEISLLITDELTAITYNLMYNYVHVEKQPTSEVEDCL